MQAFSSTHLSRLSPSTGTLKKEQLCNLKTSTHSNENNCKRPHSWHIPVNAEWYLSKGYIWTIGGTRFGCFLKGLMYSPIIGEWIWWWMGHSEAFFQTYCLVKMSTKSVYWLRTEMLKTLATYTSIYLQKPNKLTQQTTLCTAWKKTSEILVFFQQETTKQFLITIRINKATLNLWKHSHVLVQCGLL